jgi:uncharacterized protein YbjT (DUF2867 family)
MGLRTVAVAGATGNAGKHIIQGLASHGAAVRALVRDPEKLGDTRQYCSEIKTVQVTDSRSIRGSLDGVDGFISAVGKTRQKDRIDRRTVDVQANVDLFAEAARAGVDKIGFVSVAGASHTHPASMMRMKADAEDGLKQTGVPHLIVQPSGYFSDLWDAFTMCQRGWFCSIGSGKTLFNPISLSDLGEFVASQFLDAQAQNVTRPIGGPQVLRMDDLATICEGILKRKVRRLHIPLRLAEAAVGLIKPFDRNAWELGEFFVNSIGWAERHGGSMVVPQFGTETLGEYFSKRYRVLQ